MVTVTQPMFGTGLLWTSALRGASPTLSFILKVLRGAFNSLYFADEETETALRTRIKFIWLTHTLQQGHSTKTKMGLYGSCPCTRLGSHTCVGGATSERRFRREALLVPAVPLRDISLSHPCPAALQASLMEMKGERALDHRHLQGRDALGCVLADVSIASDPALCLNIGLHRVGLDRLTKLICTEQYHQRSDTK